MKLSRILLLVVAVGVDGQGNGEKKNNKEAVEPTMEVLQSLNLADKKICSDGEYIQVSCNINILEEAPEEAVEDRRLDTGTNLRRRLQNDKKAKEDKKKQEEVKPVFLSYEMGLEITDCSNSIKGANMTNSTANGRDLVAEGEAFGSQVKIGYLDAASNEEGYIIREGRIQFFEGPTYAQKLLGFTKGSHVGNILWKVVLNEETVIDQRELWQQMTLSLQASADAVMYNDTGFMLNDIVPQYSTNVKLVSSSVEWEAIHAAPCSPDWAAALEITDSPTIAPSIAPSKSEGPTDYPTSSNMPTITGFVQASVKECANEFRLRLQTDNYGGETSYKLTAGSGGTIVEAASNTLGNDSVFSVTQCLPEGGFPFTFTISDVHGDGICCGSGSGNYELYLNGNLIKDSPGTFEFSESTIIPAP